MAMKAFSERNPVIIAAGGLVLLLVIGLAVFYSDHLPFVGAGKTYAAEFTDAGGLAGGDDVRVAGVKIGKVTGISLEGQGEDHHVRVEFQMKGTPIGDRSTIAIKIKTVLGQEYLAISPSGDVPQSPHNEFPLSRTSTPINVQEALNGLASRAGSIDEGQLAEAFNTLSDTFENTPEQLSGALAGLKSLSTTIASQDQQLRDLAQNASGVTQVLVNDNAQVNDLFESGSQLVDELNSRSAAITQLLNGTREFAVQLQGLISDNQKSLTPALTKLNTVADILLANRNDLEKALSAIGPYYTLLNDAAGNGPWIDIYVCGLFDGNSIPIIDKTALRNCHPGGS